jgi:hypothetical protein
MASIDLFHSHGMIEYWPALERLAWDKPVVEWWVVKLEE